MSHERKKYIVTPLRLLDIEFNKSVSFAHVVVHRLQNKFLHPIKLAISNGKYN